MNKPRLGELNQGALSGAIVGAIGGLFAVGIPPAILFRDPALLFETPLLGMIGWLISGAGGWFLGGQIGPRLESKFGERKGNFIGGIIGGVVPVIAIALWSWHMVAPR